jgi:glycosyltransferase involved in cell wall biosynthesis
MTRVLFAIPGDLATLTGGYGYDRKIIQYLPAFDVEPDHRILASRFPFPTVDDLNDAVAAIARDPNGAPVMVDGLAFGAMPVDVVRAIGAPIIALVHHPVGLEQGLARQDAERLIGTERAALGLAAHVIVTSAATAATLANDFGVAPEKITVAEPGVARQPRFLRAATGEPLLLAVGAIMPRKGYDILVEALAGLRDLDWRLRIVGSLDRHPTTVAALREQIAAAGLAERIDLSGAEDALDPIYRAADVFVLASHYEGYGMALTEAMAHGLPIVTTAVGAAADAAPPGAALTVPPNDPRAMRDALREIIGDVALRARLSEAAWRAAQALPTWEGAAAKIADVIKRVAGETFR